MSWLKALASPITSVVTSVVGIFQSKQERKKLAEKADAKLKQAKLTGENEITLTDAEWEAISARLQAGSWKDEYITIVITAPLVMLIIGSVLTVFNDDPRLVTAGIESIKHFKEAGIDMGLMMEAVVLAAVGLKIWRKA